MMKTVRQVALHAGVDDLHQAPAQEVHGPAGPDNHGHGQGHGLVSDRRDITTSARLLQNAAIPPIAFPGGKNPYLDRPLPLPPPPKATVMPARPKTSSGPSNTSPARDIKRMSKDDMALASERKLEMHRGKNGLQPYVVGIKGGPRPLTPEPSPGTGSLRTPSPAPIRTIPPRMPTPDSIYSGEIPIGMALGSPSHVNFIASSLVSSPENVGDSWQPPPRVQRPVVIEEPYTPPVVLPIRQPQQQARQQPTPEPAIQRTKTQKRKLFASLFGGRKNAPDQQQAKTMEKAEANLSTVSITVTGPSGEVTTPSRSNTIGGKKAAKHKPIIIRSNTISSPSRPDFRMDSRLDTSEPVPFLSSSPISRSASPSGGVGLLDIEIPDVRLERYSIMFSGVLNSNGAGRPKSTLLERRQATLEKLKTISDEQEKERTRPPQRRATSPQPTKSPGFALFPSTGAATSSISLPIPNRRLARSNTSPANLPSPSRPSFDSRQLSEKQVQRAKKTVTIVSPRAMNDLNRAAHVEKLREQLHSQQPQHQQQQQAMFKPQIHASSSTTSFHSFRPDESSLILDSPNSFSTFATDDSDSEGDDVPSSSARSGTATAAATATATATATAVPISVKIPIIPRPPQEPEWQMISPPSSDSSVSTKRTNMSSGSTTSLSTRPSMDSVVVPVLQVEDDDAALKAAVEISIARQISISRQQRTMLLGGSTMSSGARARSGSAANAGKLGSDVTVKIVKGRVVETKLAVPTVVMAGGSGHRIRRSEVGEVVDV